MLTVHQNLGGGDCIWLGSMPNFKHEYIHQLAALLFITVQSYHELFSNRSKATNESYICCLVSFWALVLVMLLLHIFDNFSAFSISRPEITEKEDCNRISPFFWRATERNRDKRKNIESQIYYQVYIVVTLNIYTFQEKYQKMHQPLRVLIAMCFLIRIFEKKRNSYAKTVKNSSIFNDNRNHRCRVSNLILLKKGYFRENPIKPTLNIWSQSIEGISELFTILYNYYTISLDGVEKIITYLTGIYVCLIIKLDAIHQANAKISLYGI